MSEGVLTTLLGAVAGLVIAIVSSLIIPLVQKKQDRAEHKRGIYEKYAQPLAADAVNLLWRLDEILFKQRAQYLALDAPPTPFNEYKLISTCYRIGAVLGWIRAIRLEQSYLFFGEATSVDDLRRAVISLESALADSPHVEAQVLRTLARLWEIELPGDGDETSRIAAQASADFQHFLAQNGLVGVRYVDARPLGELSEAEQLELVRRIARSITAMLQRPPVPEDLLERTRPAALAAMAVRQAWIYRDWQAAIGDLVIRKIEEAVRRYDIIGYGAFETLFRDQGQGQLWFGRLRDLVVGLEVVRPDPSDFRLEQLQRVACALGSLICAIERLDLERKILDPQACQLARKMIATFAAPTARTGAAPA